MSNFYELSDQKSEVVGPAGSVDQIKKFDRSIDCESSKVISPVEKRLFGFGNSSVVVHMHVRFHKLEFELKFSVEVF